MNWTFEQVMAQIEAKASGIAAAKAKAPSGVLERLAIQIDNVLPGRKRGSR